MLTNENQYESLSSTPVIRHYSLLLHNTKFLRKLSTDCLFKWFSHVIKYSIIFHLLKIYFVLSWYHHPSHHLLIDILSLNIKITSMQPGFICIHILLMCYPHICTVCMLLLTHKLLQSKSNLLWNELWRQNNNFGQY